MQELNTVHLSELTKNIEEYQKDICGVVSLENFVVVWYLSSLKEFYFGGGGGVGSIFTVKVSIFNIYLMC